MRLNIDPFEIRFDVEENAWYIYGPGIKGRKESSHYSRERAEQEALELRAIYNAGWNDRAQDKN